MTLIYSGLAVGAIYAVVALGYNLLFAASGTFNFAQAQLVMLGVFLSYWGLVTLSLPVAVVFILSTVSVAAVAVVEDFVAIRPVSTPDGHLVTTLGFALIIAGFCQVKWGVQPLSVPFFGSQESRQLFGGALAPSDAALILAAPVLVFLIVVLSRYTKFGLAVLAIAEDREAASLKGANVTFLVLLAGVVAGGLAGIVGPLVGPKTFAVASLGTVIALKSFVAVAIGGFGSNSGALVGGLTVGLVEAISTFYLGTEYATISIFFVLMAVLLLLPGGLFATVKERAV